MKAVAIQGFNTDPVLMDVPPPRPGEGEVLVDVQFASINGMDAMTWAGVIEGMMPYVLPITLGRDFSGTVAAVGAGVTDIAVGDAVFGMTLSMPLHDGTFAEQVAVSATGLARRPEQLDPKSAGALGLAGTAAKLGVDAVDPAAGRSVLVVGATGGVGAIAIQLAKARGAVVVATARPEEVGFVRDLGADHTVDYRGDLTGAVRRLYPGGVDGVLHAAGDPAAVADLLAPGGRWASTLGVGADRLDRRDVQAAAVMAVPNGQILAGLAAAVTGGDLRVPISKTYPIEQIAAALKDFTSGSRGKIAVAVR